MKKTLITSSVWSQSAILPRKKSIILCLTSFSKQYEKDCRCDLYWACTHDKQATVAFVCVSRLRKCLEASEPDMRHPRASKKSML